MMTDDGWELAHAVLRGERKAPRAPPERIALASALPRAAEELRCLGKAPQASVSQTLTALWMSLEPDEFDQEDFGTPQLGAGCLEAAELLGIELSPRMRPTRLPSFGERPADFHRHRRDLAPPRVYAPLVNEAPARVFHTARPGPADEGDDVIRETASLVKRFLGVEAPRWGLDRGAPGRSKMAALFVRALLERHPGAEEVMSARHMGFSDPQELGITGELDAQGLALPVGELEYKVQQFFTRFPKGRLFVPASQWKQARACLDKLHPLKEPDSFAELAERRGQIQPFLGVLDLQARLGISNPASPETVLFEKLRQASRLVPCWNTQVLDVEETLSLALARQGGEASRSDRTGGGEPEHQLLEDLLELWRFGHSRSAYVEGGPGSGKSIVLRRLNARLLRGDTLFGLALRVDGRGLIRARLSLSEALHEANATWMSQEESRWIVELAQSPRLAGSVWLLVDGLDEVSSDDRRRLREFIARWPGPSVLGSRPLPNEITGAPHVRVQPLDSYQQSKLFELEGKPGHLEILTGAQARLTGDRRKEMVADLCSTPLGISLLAMLSEEELGERLDVATVLERCIARLLERAESAGRISKLTRMTVLTRGLGVLGAAAWSMIRRGDGTLTSRDLEAMEAPRDLQEAVYEVLEGSDFVQRVGPDLYQFSHKSFAEFCAAYHLIRKPEAEEELLALAGEPGAEAVAFHFGAKLGEPGRLTRFIQRLASNPRHPMSSLALATRLLVVNGPERVAVEAALEVLVRRLRIVAHFRMPGRHGFVLPGGLDEDGELWLAIERWGSALRPHAEVLLDACPPDVRRFLRGELPPLRYVYENYAHRRSDEHAAADIAESLATRLGLEPPLPVLIRFAEASSILLARPEGPWIRELEPLFEATADEMGADVASTAASVWAARAPASRQLEYLEALSRGIPAAVAPVLETVRQWGSPAQKREALLRAALNSLELGEMDEGDWVAKVRFAQRATGVGSEQWLKQWDLLWACGLIGDCSKRSQALEPLYAEFIHDACGPARWRALLALAKLHGSVDDRLLRSALQDEFRPVRVAAIVQLVSQGAALTVNDVRASLASLDDHERWMAFNALGAGKTEPIELLLPVLARETPRQEEPHYPKAWLPTETPWQQSVRQSGEDARWLLVRDALPRMRDSSWPSRLADMLDGPLSAVAEEVFPSHDVEVALFQRLLATGSPRQRRFAAKALLWDQQELLAPYVDDADPEIADRARRVMERKREHLDRKGTEEARRAQERARSERERRPVISLEEGARAESFEELWRLLSTHRLPHSIEAQMAYFTEEKKLRMSFGDERPGRLESVSERERKPLIQRLRQLYRPHHRPLLLAGLEDDDLEPFSVALLREHLSNDDMLALIPRGGRALSSAISILGGTRLGQRAPDSCERNSWPGGYREIRSRWKVTSTSRTDSVWLTRASSVTRVAGSRASRA